MINIKKHQPKIGKIGNSTGVFQTSNNTYNKAGLTYNNGTTVYGGAGGGAQDKYNLPIKMGQMTQLGTGTSGGLIWKGYAWTRRTDEGAPHYNGSWDPANVIGPDGDNHMTLRLTNPSGTFPIAAEFYTVQEGFGYGVYTSVIATRLDTLYKSTVFGGMFTYDNNNSYVTNNEIDVHETSAWGEAGSVQLEHTYFINSGGVKTGVTDGTNIPTDILMTHRMRWQPGKITWDSFKGVGVDGTVALHTVQTNQVGTPAQEVIDFNLWVFGDGPTNPALAPQQDVTIQDFTFVAGTPLMSTLTDNFNDNLISAAKWVTVAAGGATVTETGGQLAIAMPSSSTSSTDGELQSAQNYNMTANGAYLKVIQMPLASTNALAIFRIYTDGSNYLQFIYQNGTCYMQDDTGGTPTTIGSFLFNAVTHAWLRIRESSGTIFWDTSTDGSNWTNRGSRPNSHTITLSNVLAAGICFQNETNPGSFIIDNFNTLT